MFSPASGNDAIGDVSASSPCGMQKVLSALLLLCGLSWTCGTGDTRWYQAAEFEHTHTAVSHSVCNEQKQADTEQHWNVAKVDSPSSHMQWHAAHVHGAPTHMCGGH